MAEGVGFEPTVTCATPVFKTGAFNQTLPPLRGKSRADDGDGGWKGKVIMERGLHIDKPGGAGVREKG